MLPRLASSGWSGPSCRARHTHTIRSSGYPDAEAEVQHTPNNQTKAMGAQQVTHRETAEDTHTVLKHTRKASLPVSADQAPSILFASSQPSHLSLTWARGQPGLGPLCGRMACLTGAQSKLNLHLGAPSGRSVQSSHRSLLMASSKCGAAASAPGSGRPRPRLALGAKWCLPKSILATVHAAQASWSPAGCPSPGLSRDHQGPLLPSQLTLGLTGYLKARHQQALAKVAEEQQFPTSFLPGA